MRKNRILVVIILAFSVLICSCSRRYYSNHPGKVTKGYKKPPREWKKSPSRYPTVNVKKDP